MKYEQLQLTAVENLLIVMKKQLDELQQQVARLTEGNSTVKRKL